MRGDSERLAGLSGAHAKAALPSEQPYPPRQVSKAAGPWIQLITELVQGLTRHSQLPLTVGTETRDGSPARGSVP